LVILIGDLFADSSSRSSSGLDVHGLAGGVAAWMSAIVAQHEPAYEMN